MTRIANSGIAPRHADTRAGMGCAEATRTSTERALRPGMRKSSARTGASAGESAVTLETMKLQKDEGV